jgi:aminopeptidase N
MNNLLRTCKCHWVGTDYQHWGNGFRRAPFAPAGTAPQFAPDTPVVAIEMRVSLHLDPAKERAWGTTTHELKVQAPSVHEVRFHARNLEFGRVTVNGRSAAFENTGEQIAVTLPKAAKAGESFSIGIEHSVTRPVAGLYFTNPDAAYPKRFRTAWSQGQDEDTRYYLPCLDSPLFKQKTEALLYVPKGWFALSNGELVKHNRGVTGTEDLWHYRLEHPYSTYLFSVVAGEFSEYKDKGKTAPEVRWYVQKGREKEGRNAFGNTADILRFLSEFTQVPYPYRQYTQIAVPDFIFGGMENFTVTTQTDLTLHDDRAHLDFSSDDLVAHEAAHSWFGNLVTCRGWAHAWLHESFATYMEALYKRHKLGPQEFDYQLLQDAEAYFHEDGRYRRPLVTHRYEQPIDLFDAHLYPGGAVRLRTLHALLGEDTFRNVLKLYLGRHRWGAVETVDFGRAIQDVTGVNYDWWFQQWIHGAGYPALEVSYTWKNEERLAEVVVKQTRPYEDGTVEEKHKPWFKLPLKVGFRVGGRFLTLPLHIEGQETRALYRLEHKPTLVLFDPAYECPAKTVKFQKPQDLLIAQLHEAPGSTARIEAAVSLAEKPGEPVLKALDKALKQEKFWGVQQRIARALGKIGGAAARDALIAALDTRHPKARRAVVEALGHFKDDAIAAATLEKKAARGDASYYVEAELARALGRCRAPKAASLIETFLKRPSHAEAVRVGAYDGLAELARENTLATAEKGARYGAPALARVAAIRAVGELARRHFPLRKAALDLLQSMAEHADNPSGSFRGKMAALRAMESIGDLDAIPVLERVAAREADGRLVRLAKNVRANLRESAARPAEVQALRGDVESAVKENKALRDRVEVLEQTRGPRHSAPGKADGKAEGKKAAARRGGKRTRR